MVFLKRIKKKSFVRESFFIIGLIFIILPVILPYFHQGYFPTHDGEWAVVRLADMFRSIRDLQFPVRYSGSLNFGYGYPLFNFAYPMPYYLGLLFVFLKFGFVGSIKAIFVLSVIFSAIGMYLLSKRVFASRSAGIISAVLYTYMPYHLVDLFVRGSIGESVSFALFPFILLFVYNLFTHKEKLFFSVLAGIFLSLLIPTHNIMAVLFIPVLLVFVAGLYFSKLNRVHPGYFVILFSIGLGLSAFFYLPALLEKQNIVLSVIPIADRSLYFVNPLALLFSPFGYGTPTDVNPFSYQIGLPLILTFLIVCFLLIKRIFRSSHDQKNTFILFLAGLAVVFLFLLFSPAEFIWRTLPLLKEINYPWTLLSQIGLIFSFVAGFLCTQKKLYTYIAVLCGVLVIWLYMPYAKPYEYVDRGDMYYMTNHATTTSSNELMPLWVSSHPNTLVDTKVILQNNQGSISDLSVSSDEITFHASLASSAAVRINTIYYPGWVVTKDNTDIHFTYENDLGVIDIQLPQGKHTIRLEFTETPLRIFANMLSVLTFLTVFIYLIYKLVSKTSKITHAK